MALRLKKDIKKASYYVWFLGAQESRGLRGDQYVLPAIRILEERSKDLEPFKVTLQVSHKGLKIIQVVTSKGKQQTIKHFIPSGSVTSAAIRGDVVGCVLLLYNPLTGCPVHVHAYRCDSEHTADMLYTHLLTLIERPENQKKFADIERKLQLRGAILHSKKPPDSSLGSEVSRESDSGSNEERSVVNLYDSLAAELKQKLSTGKSPILLPPRDYDTVHRQKGNLNNIDTRRCLNQNIVGINARRKLESSGGSSGIGSDLAPSPERNEYPRQDNHSTSEEDWTESTAYLMHEAYDSSPPRRAASPKCAVLPRRALSPRRAVSPHRALSPRRAVSPRSPRRAISPHRAVSPRHPALQNPVHSPRRAAARREISPRRNSSPHRYRHQSSYEEDLDQYKDELTPYRDFDRRRKHENFELINDKLDKFVDDTNYRRRYAVEGKVNRSVDRDSERRFGKLQRGASEGSLQIADASPKDRFNVAKEKFMNLERERLNKELAQHIAIRRSIIERNGRSSSSPDEERIIEKAERSRREIDRFHWDVDSSHVKKERYQEYSRDLDERDFGQREIEKLPRVGRKRDGVKRYEHSEEEYLNTKSHRGDLDHGRIKRELDRRIDEDDIIEPVIEENRSVLSHDRQRGFNRSRLVDEHRQWYFEDDKNKFYDREYRDFHDLSERKPTKFRHSYAEPIPRGRLGAVRPY